jgi:hypothetical protein
MGLIKQNDDDSDLEISKHEGEHPEESTFSSDVEEHNLNNQQDLLHLDLVHRDKKI